MPKKLTKKQKEEIIKKYGKIPTKEEMFQKIKESQERMMSALAGAWEEAPDEPEIKRQLLEAVEKAGKMRKKIYQDLLDEDPPKI